jgi:MATE family multidrug resistance protein
MEEGGYLALVYLSGSLATTDVAAISAMYSVWSVLWAFYWGLGLALQVRLGFHLGAGRPERAQAVAKISVGVVVVLIGSLATACYLLRWQLAELFSEDPVLIATIARSTYMMCLDYVVTCAQFCAENVMEGMSMNTPAAVVQGVGTWLVHLPLTVYLMLFCPAFKTEPATAFFLGSTVAGTVKAVVMWVIVIKTDWRKQSDLAIERSERGEGDDGEEEEEQQEKRGEAGAAASGATAEAAAAGARGAKKGSDDEDASQRMVDHQLEEDEVVVMVGDGSRVTSTR